MDIHLVVGEHETDPLVLADRLAEGGAAPRVVGGDVVGAARRTQPPHAPSGAPGRAASGTMDWIESRHPIGGNRGDATAM
jgi:hypothetical protein